MKFQVLLKIATDIVNTQLIRNFKFLSVIKCYNKITTENSKGTCFRILRLYFHFKTTLDLIFPLLLGDAQEGEAQPTGLEFEKKNKVTVTVNITTSLAVS